MFELFKMWVLVEAFGLLCLPLTVTVFHNLPDRGWALGKSLGMTVFAFSVWLPLMCFHILPYNQLFLSGVLLILLAGSVIGFWRTRHSILKVLRRNSTYAIASEAIFLGMVLLLGILRQFRPDIRSWETLMDEGIIAGIMRSPHLPPNDVWLSGYAINYYYYAHFTIATMGKLIGQAPSIVFNTGISIFFGLTATNLFGVSCNIAAWAKYVRINRKTNKDETIASVHLQSIEPAHQSYPSLLNAIPFGLCSLTMGVLFGNLVSAGQWWEDVTKHISVYDWFSPSRVIPSTINEFPAFSFLLSDFHAHVLTLALTILAIGIAFNLLLEHDGLGLNVFGHGWHLPFTLFTTALIIGQLFVMNGWDLPTYLALSLVTIALQQWLSSGSAFKRMYIINVALAWISLSSLVLLLFIPFYRSYIVPTGGIGIVKAPDRSAFHLELLIHGIFLFIFVSLLLVSAWRQPLFARNTIASKKIWYLVGILVVLLLDSTILLLLHNSLTFVVMGDIALAGLVLIWHHKEERALAFTLLVGTVAFALVASCEVFYLRDLFEASGYPRYNTVFKFYFQAWTLLSIASGAGLFFILERFWYIDNRKPGTLLWFRSGGKIVWVTCLIVLALASLIYPIVAPTARLSTYNTQTHTIAMTPTWNLDGMTYLKNCRPPDEYPGMDSDPATFCNFNVTNDYEAIRWINMHIQGDPIIVEAADASSGDYTLHALVSSFTGLPTIMGWYGHEIQWRNGWLQQGTNSNSFIQRLNDIDTIYTSSNPRIISNLMHFYHAQYLYVGSIEYAKYSTLNPPIDLNRFSSFMQTIYNKDGVAIYKVN